MPPMNKNMRSNEKINFSVLKKLVLFSKKYFVAIIVAIMFAIGGSVCIVIGPDKLGSLVSELQKAIVTNQDIDMKNFVSKAITILSIYVIGAILSYGQQFIMATITQKTSKNFRTAINNKINKLPLNYFDTTTVGDVLSRVTNDIDTVSQTLSQSIGNLISSIVLFIGVLFMMIKNNVILSITTIGATFLGFGLMSICIKASQKYFVRKQKVLGQMNGQIEEVYSHHNVVRAYNASHLATEEFANYNYQLYECNWKSQFLSGCMPSIMTFIGNLSYVLIFVVGVYLANNDISNVDLGVISTFVIYARLFSQPLTTFAQSMSSLQQASAASVRVFELLEKEEMPQEDEKMSSLPEVVGNIEFKDICFGYDEKQIINNFSVNIKSGQKVAIVGPTGAGKTTIVNLLMKFYDIEKGDILIDGISIKDMKRQTVHDLFDMILQDTWLFNGTIRENLSYNKKGITTAHLDLACQAVGLSNYINSLEKGYDTVLDDNSQLSEGQKQQFTIARAMIKNAPLLILDEATSSVDTRTEVLIQKAMDELTAGRTSFVIAHRLSTIKNADLILVLNNGDIVEMGNHQELLNKKGFYYDLYNSQFENV